MSMRTLEIDWADLELAFRDATGAESWLDRETGEVLTLMKGYEDERDVREKVGKSPDRFLRLPPVEKDFTLDVLRAFAPRCAGELAQRLAATEEGPGGIARAMALLREDKPAWARFARFEQDALVRRIEGFLSEHGLRSAGAAPPPDLFEGQ